MAHTLVTWRALQGDREDRKLGVTTVIFGVLSIIFGVLSFSVCLTSWDVIYGYNLISKDT